MGICITHYLYLMVVIIDNQVIVGNFLSVRVLIFKYIYYNCRIDRMILTY